MNYTCYNGSPQKIPFQFANGKLPHSRCRAFWAYSGKHFAFPHFIWAPHNLPMTLATQLAPKSPIFSLLWHVAVAVLLPRECCWVSIPFSYLDIAATYWTTCAFQAQNIRQLYGTQNVRMIQKNTSKTLFLFNQSHYRMFA